MPNAVLESLRAQRAEQIATMDSILSQVVGRDLVDAERGLLEAARARIAELDAQIGPLEEYEKLREAHAATVAGPAGIPSQVPGVPSSGVPAVPRRVDGADRQSIYRSAGEYIVDLIRARGIHTDPDPAAAQRIAQTRAVADQITSDTPGILPTPIVGSVVNLIDANRPLISSVGGAIGLGGIPGKTFTRPKITQHTLVGPQTAEKTQLPSQKMIINSVPFTKETYGGTVDISRQDIDWTSPGAWDILVGDLADVYAIQTENAVSAAFVAALTAAPVTVADNTLAAWALALYTAAARSYSAGKRMPDRVWVSLNVWAALGSLTDVARLVLPPSQTEQPAGSASLASFMGDVIGLPRIVVPELPAGTCVVGPSSLYEVYEEVIGLLSVIEPSILGVTVAYGGYVAFGNLEPSAFIPLAAPADLPFVVGEDAPEDDETPKAKK